MSDNYITNVLNILRLMKHTGRYDGNTTLSSLIKWCPQGPDDTTMLRIAAYVQDQCNGALDVIDASNLSDEAKAGLTQIAKGLKTAFQIPHINNHFNSYIPQLDSALSSFAILASVYAAGDPPSQNKELQELIRDVEGMLAAFENAEVGGVVSSVAKRHLHVLLTLLNNVDALGIDAALAAYAELVVRLRTADANAPPEVREQTAGFWDAISGWGKRLSEISDAVGSGTKLLENGKRLAQGLIGYFGP